MSVVTGDGQSAQRFHGLTADPFQPEYGPILIPPQQHIAEAVAASLRSGRALTIVEGEAGIGRKTAVSAALAAFPADHMLDIANTLLLTGEQLRRQAEAALENAARTGGQGPLILIFQAADTLRESAQTGLAALLHDRKGQVQAILLGSPMAGGLLLQGPLGMLEPADRIVLHLPPPSCADMREMLRLAIEQAGQTLPAVMTQGAVDNLLAQVGTNPARLAGLTRQALILAQERGVKPVDKAIVEMVGGHASRQSGQQPLITPIIAIFIATVILALVSCGAIAILLPATAPAPAHDSAPQPAAALPGFAIPDTPGEQQAALPDLPESPAALELPAADPVPPPASATQNPDATEDNTDDPQPPHPYRLTRSGSPRDILLGTIGRGDNAAIEALREVNPGLSRTAFLPAGVILLMPSQWPDPPDGPAPAQSARAVPKPPHGHFRHRPSWCDRARPSTPASIIYVQQQCGK